MITENTAALSQALVAQIQSCATNNNLVGELGRARTPEEVAAILSEIDTTQYLHNHQEIVRIFQATEPTEYQPE